MSLFDHLCRKKNMTDIEVVKLLREALMVTMIVSAPILGIGMFCWTDNINIPDYYIYSGTDAYICTKNYRNFCCVYIICCVDFTYIDVVYKRIVHDDL